MFYSRIFSFPGLVSNMSPLARRPVIMSSPFEPNFLATSSKFAPSPLSSSLITSRGFVIAGCFCVFS